MQRGVAWSKAGREHGECHRVDIQWEAAETGGWEQQVAGQAERERQGRVHGAGSQMGGNQWHGDAAAVGGIKKGAVVGWYLSGEQVIFYLYELIN